MFFFEKRITGSRFNPFKKKNDNFTRIKPFNEAQRKQEQMEFDHKIESLENKLKDPSKLDEELYFKLTQELVKTKKSFKKFKGYVRDLVNRRGRIFLPGFVHCSDGAMIRLIIYEVKNRTSYDVNHVYDSINIHANFVDDFYRTVKDLYKP